MWESKSEKEIHTKRLAFPLSLSHLHFLIFTFHFHFFQFHFLTFTFTFSCSLSHLHLLTFSLSLSHFHILTFTQIVRQLPCCCHAAARFCTHILPHRKRNCRWSSKSRLCWNALQDLNYSFKFGHEMLSLTYLATRWHHLRELQSWPPDGTTRNSHKVVHQMAPLALVPNLTTRWCQLH